MADLSKIKLNGTTYNFKDAEARKGTSLWNVTSDNDGHGEYWWILQLQQSGLYQFTNAPGSNGALRYINLPAFKHDSSTINISLEMPTQSGKIALTSDIPSVYSSTNTGGYLTMATLPIYDGTVE